MMAQKLKKTMNAVEATNFLMNKDTNNQNARDQLQDINDKLITHVRPINNGDSSEPSSSDDD